MRRAQTLTRNASLRRTAVHVTLAAVLLAPAFAFAQSPPADSTIVPVSPVQRLAERTAVVGSEGHARQVPGSAHFLGLDILPFQDQSFANVHRLMLRIPGVYAAGEDGYGLRPNLGMRTADPYRSAGILLLEDGVPIAPAPYAAPGLPVFAGLGRVEAIETLKGPGAIAHGPYTTGGTVNFMTLGVPDDLAAQARLSLGSNDASTLQADYGDSWGNVSWLLGLNQTRTDGFKALDDGGGTGFEHDDYLVKLRLRSGPDAGLYQDVMFKLGHFETDANDSYLGLSDEDFAATPFRRYAASQEDHMQHNATQLLLRHFIAVNDVFDVTTSLYRNDADLDWYLLEGVNGESPSDVLASPQFFADEYGILTGDSTSADGALEVKANTRTYFSTGIQSVLGARFATGRARHDLTVGLRYHEDEEDRLHRSDGWRMNAGGAMTLTSRGTDGGAGGADNQVNEAHALAGFVRDCIAGGRWTVTPGLRVEWVEATQASYAAGDAARAAAPLVVESSVTVLLPGLGVTYRAADEVLLLGGIHRGFSPPQGGGDGYDAAHVEAGARVKQSDFNAALIGFLSDLGLVQSTGKLRSAWGLEASAGYAITNPEYGVALDVAYTFSRAEYEGYPFAVGADDPFPYEDGDDIPYIPEHSVNASLALTTQKSYAGVSAGFVSHVRTEPGSGEFIDSQSADDRFLLDIVTEFEIIRHVRLFASVYNTTDEVYVASRFPYGAHPGAPRSFTAGLKFAF